MTSTGSNLSALVSKLRRLASIDQDDERAVLSLPHRVSRVSAREYIVREGAVPSECCILTKGYASRSKLAADGGCQIVSFHITGDMLDLQHLCGSAPKRDPARLMITLCNFNAS